MNNLIFKIKSKLNNLDLAMQRRIVLIICAILLIITILMYANFNINFDKLENSDMNVYYRVYSNDKWSKWSKNGETSGDIKTSKPITNIEIKYRKKYKFKKISLPYRIYNNKVDWTSRIYDFKEVKAKSTNGLVITHRNKTLEGYNVCYRTYNNKNKWLEWSCDGAINGNKNVEIRAIQIKIIPEGVIENEYLKDFNNNDNPSSIGF